MIPEAPIPPQEALRDHAPSPGSQDTGNGQDDAMRGGDGAERQRRYRLRQLAGIQVVTIEVNDATMDLMMVLGWLDEWDQGNKESIADAVERIVDEHLQSGGEPAK